MTDDGCHSGLGRGPEPGPVGDAPVMVDVWRGALVESRHRGRAVVVDAAGRIRAAWGCPETRVYPRSAIKAVQALPLVETGAFDAFSLSAAELALACGSHHGEARHLRLAGRWLERIGCRLDDLACGAHPPLDPEVAVAMERGGLPVTALCNNCSGKHVGMLTTARHCGEPLADYIQPDHPVQRRIFTALADMTDGGALCPTPESGNSTLGRQGRPSMGVGGDGWPLAIDGCGVPTLAVSLRGLATAMARFADPRHLPPSRMAAIERICAAWRRRPGLIGGRTSFDTQLMLSARGAVLVKSGAEGVAMVAVPAMGLGLALKIEDGTPRAKNVAVMAILRHLGVFDAKPDRAYGFGRGLDALAAPILTNWAGTVVGRICPAPDWLSQKIERE